MSWTELRPRFCESIVSGPPEYVNAITSLFIAAAGFFGIYLNRQSSALIRFICAILALTGLTSVPFHLTLQSGWGYLDSTPMLLSSYMGVYAAYDLTLYIFIGDDRRTYEFWSGTLAFIVATAMCFSMALNTFDETEQYFPILFLIPEGFIAAYVLFARFYIYRDYFRGFDSISSESRELRRAFRVMSIGFGCALVAGILWGITEPICSKAPWLRYIYAHAIWHFGIAYGMYNLIVFIMFVNAFHRNKKPHFIEGRTPAQRVFYTVIPAIISH